MNRFQIFVFLGAGLGAGLGAVACGDQSTPPAIGNFNLGALTTATSSDFYDIPFPNDLRLTADGHIDLSLYPHDSPYLGPYIFDVITRETKGFGLNAPIIFRFSGPIDPNSLPSSPDASRLDGASVYLVDVDPTSPEIGQKRPLRFRFETEAQETIGPNWLSCLPYPGFPLREKTTYAVVVTTRVRGADGKPLSRSVDFDSIMKAGVNDTTRAIAVYRPLLAYLDAPGGDERADVALATVFTTQDATGMMSKLRQVVYGLPVPSAAGTTKGATQNGYTIFTGTYSGPNFQTGTPPYTTSGGEILVDDTGMPIVQRMENIRWAATIPTGCTTPTCTWPVVVYAHGTGGDYESFIRDGTAQRMAAQGLAVISNDEVLHGTRVPAGTDPTLFFNFNNIVAARDNVRQGALDDFQVVRLAQVISFNDGSHTHGFDANRIYFMGHSQGCITGVPFLAYEGNVKGAILSGAGALLIEALLHKTEPIDITALVATIDRDYPLDEFDPILALVQTFIEPADGMNYGPYLMRTPPPGLAPKDIYQSDGIIDHYAPPPGIEALGIAIGLTPVTPMVYDVPGFALRGLSWTAPGFSNNLNGHTGAFIQYDVRPNGEGHFVVFDVPTAQRQHAQFLGTLAATGTATLVP